MPRKSCCTATGEKSESISRSSRIGSAVCLVAGIAGCIFFMQFFSKPMNSNSLAQLNQPIPSLMVENSGVLFDLKKYIAGKRAVLVFYSPNCRICKEVIPFLNPMPSELKLILINESSSEEKSLSAQFPGADQLRDPRRALTQSFATILLPTILFVDQNGILREGIAGHHQRDFIQNRLKQFSAAHPIASDIRP
jgi:thioredoxin-related protein